MKGARKSAEVQRRRAHARMAMTERIGAVVDRVGNDDLSTLFNGTAAGLVVALVEGDLPVIESTLDYLRLVEAADKLHKMGRLAAGEATSIAFGAHANVDLDALAQRIEQLKVARAQRDEAERDAIDLP